MQGLQIQCDRICDKQRLVLNGRMLAQTKATRGSVLRCSKVHQDMREFPT